MFLISLLKSLGSPLNITSYTHCSAELRARAFLPGSYTSMYCNACFLKVLGNCRGTASVCALAWWLSEQTRRPVQSVGVAVFLMQTHTICILPRASGKGTHLNTALSVAMISIYLSQLLWKQGSSLPTTSVPGVPSPHTCSFMWHKSIFVDA